MRLKSNLAHFGSAYFKALFLNSTTHVKCCYSNKSRRTIGKLGKVVKVSFTLALEIRLGDLHVFKLIKEDTLNIYSSLYTICLRKAEKTKPSVA